MPRSPPHAPSPGIAPRREDRQRLLIERRLPCPRRPRHRARAEGGRNGVDRDRDAAVHGARDARGRAVQLRVRHLVAWLRAVRNVRGRAAVHREEHAGADQQDLRRHDRAALQDQILRAAPGPRDLDAPRERLRAADCRSDPGQLSSARAPETVLS
ncbi:hypothetical protein PybrP1_007889 [[Pythium] brassicae (nom. inval.)]|nr:hypothetical protein PybrP1_007889 [[Pythium] brassicae (nom. inval.)]